MSEKYYCKNCGTELFDDEDICSYCGTKQDISDTETEVRHTKDNSAKWDMAAKIVIVLFLLVVVIPAIATIAATIWFIYHFINDVGPIW